MILSGKEIEKRLGTDILIVPYTRKQLNTNSYNVKLDNKLLVYETPHIGLDMKKNNPVEEIIIPESGYWLKPNTLYLAKTVERTTTSNLVPMLEGRSSVGRLGLSIHVTAGFGDVGFDGFWTLELWCLHPLKIYPYVEIGQIYYHTIEGEYDNYISTKYQHNNDVQASKLYEDF